MLTFQKIHPCHQGSTYSFVVVDHFSKFTVIEPLKNKTAEVVAQGLVDMFCRYNVPRKIHSDNGPEFDNEVLRKIEEIYKVERLFTTATTPKQMGWWNTLTGRSLSFCTHY